MQARLAIGLSFLIISLGGFSQNFNVCNNSEVVFEMEDNYWGEPVWEYSVDSLEWDELDFDASEPFIVSEEMSGYYRLRMVDASCDTSFVSQAEFIQVNEDPEIHLTIHSWFSDNIVPEGVDPFFWVLGDTALSELTFFVNNEAFENGASGGYVPNPGSEFQIYATATHLLSGCTLFSDTATYSVPNQTIQANALFDITGNFSLSEISVSSSIDSVGLNGDSNFLIEYSESQGLDFLHAYSNNIAVDSQLVAIEIVEPGTGFITMDNTSTAVALVCSHPSLAVEMWLNFSELQAQALSHSQFSDLVSAIDNSIDVYGYLNFNGTDIQVLTSAIAENISEEINAGFQSRDLNEYPLLEPQDDGSLLYDPNGIRTFYAARLYDQTTALSSIMIMPSAQNIWQLPVVQIMLNGLMGVSEYATALTSEFVWNETITEADFSSDGTYLDFNTRLTNGLDFSPDFSSEEISIVRLINNLNIQFQMIFMVAGTAVEIIAQTPIVSLASSIIELTAAIFAGDVLTIAEIAELCLPAVGAIVGLFAGGSIVAGIIIGAAVVLATYNIAEFIAGLIVAKPEVFYTNSLLGDRLRHRITVESNIDANFAGIPGAYTYEIPYIRLTEQKRIYEGYSAESELIYEGGLNTYPFSNDVNVSSESINIQNIIVLGDIEFEGGEIESHPLEVSANVFEWQMAWNSNGGETAELDLSLNYQGQPLSEMGGLNSEGTISFEASIENPIIEIVQGNNQIGVLNEFLPEECQIQISGSNGASVYFPYPIRFDASIGGGKVQYPGQTEEYTALNTTVVSFGGEEGIGRINWKPGSGTENVLVAEVINPTNDLSLIEIEFGVNLVECVLLGLNVGSPCDDGNENSLYDTVQENCTCEGISVTNGEGVTDIDGNNYSTVIIDGREWMSENLRVSTDRYGNIIPQVSSSSQWTSFNAKWCYYDNDENNDDVYGKLYNWMALDDVCPQEWHVPTQQEFSSLLGYINSFSHSFSDTGYVANGGALKHIDFWNLPNTGATNATGFSAVAGGARLASGGFTSQGIRGSYWTSTEDSYSSNAKRYALNNYSTSFSSAPLSKMSGLSVRCIKSTTSYCDNLNQNVGDPCYDGSSETVNDSVTEDCECIGENPTEYDCPNLQADIGDSCDDGNPNTINDVVNILCNCMGIPDWDCPVLEANVGDPCDDGNSNTSNDIVSQACECLGEDEFDCPILQLNIGEGCDDGNAATVNDAVQENCICLGQLGSLFTPGEVVEYDGDIYETIILNNGQEWFKENLRTTMFNNGATIPLVSDTEEWSNLDSPAYCYLDFNESNDDSYGKLYNWYVIDEANVCPEGWRIPNYDDYGILINYLNGAWVAGGALRSETDWLDLPPITVPGNNSSGLTAVPANALDYGISNGIEIWGFDNLNARTFFWIDRESETNPDQAWRVILSAYTISAVRSTRDKRVGHSIRCLKD